MAPILAISARRRLRSANFAFTALSWSVSMLSKTFMHTDRFNSVSPANASARLPFVMGLPPAFMAFMAFIGAIASCRRCTGRGNEGSKRELTT